MCAAILEVPMAEVCSICEGAGLRVVQRDGRQFAEECVCRVQERAARRMGRAAIPRRYEHCTLESYETNFPSSRYSTSQVLSYLKRENPPAMVLKRDV